MFKRQKQVVYKSVDGEEKLKKELPFKLLVGVSCAVCVAVAILLYLIFPLYDKMELPAFYLKTYVWVVIFACILVTGGISLMFVANQGANKKVFLYFLLCGILIVANLVCAHIFHLFFVSLFLSAILLYVAFLTFHELRKTNFTAYYLFIPFVCFSIYNVVIYYFIAMLN